MDNEVHRCPILLSDGKRCSRREGHSRECSVLRGPKWCSSCRAVRPSPQVDLCGHCGGASASPHQHGLPTPSYVEGDRKHHERLAMIRRRAIAMGVGR